MRSASPSSWLCKYAVALILLRLPQSVSAQRPRRMHLRQQRQLDELEKPEVVQPSACIETGSELLNAIGDYFGSEETNITDNSAALIYGWPIEDWCLSSDVVKAFDIDSNSTLTDSVSDAVLNVADTQYDEVFAEDLIINWSTSVSRTLCTTVCPDTNGEEEEEIPPEQPLEQQEDQTLVGDSALEQPLEQQGDGAIYGDSPLILEKLEDQTQYGDSALENPPEQEDQTLFGDSPLEQPLEQEGETLFEDSPLEQPQQKEDQTIFGESTMEQFLEQQEDQTEQHLEQPLEDEEDQILFGDNAVEQPVEQQEDQTIFGESTMEQPIVQEEDETLFEDSPLEQPQQKEDETMFGESTMEQPPEQKEDQTEQPLEQPLEDEEDQILFGDNALEQPVEQQEDQTIFGESTVEQPIEQEDETLFEGSPLEQPQQKEDETMFGESTTEQPLEQKEVQTEQPLEQPLEDEEYQELFSDDYLEQSPEQEEEVIKLHDDQSHYWGDWSDDELSGDILTDDEWSDDWSDGGWDNEFSTQSPEQQEDDQILYGDDEIDETLAWDSASESSTGATNTIDNQEIIDSGSHSSESNNETTMSMLIRLIPVKLVCILALTCLVLGVRQMSLSAEGDNGYCCCCKMGCYLLGFGLGGNTSYEGIDPSDIGHQKVVEFELLQLEADGDADNDIDVVIM